MRHNAGTPKAELEFAHKVRIRAKKLLRERRYKKDGEQLTYVRANLSAHHPDAGMSFKDHAIEKASRTS